jgi:hypothetical protein
MQFPFTFNTLGNTKMNTTTGAEELVQGLLDQRNLYATSSRHERRLLDCVKDLWRAVAVKEPEVAWLEFRQWALDNKEAATQYANMFLSGYLEEHRNKKSCSHTVGLYAQAWKSWGISVSTPIVAQIAQFEKENWRPAQLTRRNKQQTNKLRQFESLDKLWPTVVEYMTNVTGNDFRVQLQSVSSNRGAHKGIASSSFNEMAVIARKSNTELSGILTCTLGYASMLRTSGMRGLTGINAKLGDFSVLEDGSVLLKRWEKKRGSTRNVSKPIYIRIVPGTEPGQDPLVYIARHAVVVSAGKQIFGHGFERKEHQDECPH